MSTTYRTKRTVVQIAAAAGGQYEDVLVALADDGTLWLFRIGADASECQWEKIRALPSHQTHRKKSQREIERGLDELFPVRDNPEEARA